MTPLSKPFTTRAHKQGDLLSLHAAFLSCLNPICLEPKETHAKRPQAFVVRALKPDVCLHGPLLLGRSSLPFASPQMPKMSRVSFDQALWPQAYVVRALKPAVCLHGPLSVVRAFKPAVCQPSNAYNPPWQLRPGALATSICWQRALRPVHGPLLLGRSSLPFASRQLRLKSPVAASTRRSGHKHFLLEPWSLPFASMVLCC